MAREMIEGRAKRTREDILLDLLLAFTEQEELETMEELVQFPSSIFLKRDAPRRKVLRLGRHDVAQMR